MKAMILAAGRGERMRPLTDICPKPLLRVGHRSLIEWHIERLARAGFKEIIINHAYLGHQIEHALGNGERWNLRIRYSPEVRALETAGGIAHALPLLGHHPFIVINGDIFCEWNFRRARAIASELSPRDLAWLLLVPNPSEHVHGDFFLQAGRVVDQEDHYPRRQYWAIQNLTLPRLTFSGIGIYRPALFSGVEIGSPSRLAPLLRQAMAHRAVIGEYYGGRWADIGTPDRLAALRSELGG